MLLSQEADTIEHLAGSAPRRLEAFLQVGILELEPVESFRSHTCGPGRGIDCLDPRLGLKRAPPETRKLIAEVSDKLLELGEGYFVRPFVV